MGAVFDVRHDLALGGGVGAEFVGDDPLRRTSLLAQEPCQQSPRSPCVPMNLHDFIEYVSFLIDSAPQIAFLTLDGDHDLVEMPYVMPRGSFWLQATRVVGAEFDRPASDRF